MAESTSDEAKSVRSVGRGTDRLGANSPGAGGSKWQGLAGSKLALLAGVAFIFAAMLSFVSCSSPAVKEVREKTLKVGLALALSGPSSETTSQVGHAMLGYLRYVNDDLGGVEYKDPKTGQTDHVKLPFFWEDNAFDTPRTVDVYKRMKDAGAQVMVVHGGGPTAAVAAAASRDRMPLHGNALASPDILNVKPIFAVPSSPPAYVPVRAFLTYIKNTWTGSRPPVVGIISVNAVWGKPVAEGIQAFGDKIGVKVLPVEELPQVVTDSSVEVKRVMEQKPDWTFVYHTTAGLVTVIKDATRLGYKDQTKWGTIGFAFIPEQLAKALPPEAIEGLHFPAFGTVFEADTPTVKLMADIMPRHWGEKLSNAHVGGWLSMQMFGEGIRLALNKTGFEALTPEAIRDGWLSLKNFDTQGTAGIISTSPERPYFTNTIIYKVEGGQVKRVVDWFVPNVD